MRFAVLALVLFACPTFADSPRAVTVDDYFSLATITQVAIASDGKQVAYVEARWDAADESCKSDLWVVNTDGASSPRRITFDKANQIWRSKYRFLLRRNNSPQLIVLYRLTDNRRSLII